MSRHIDQIDILCAQTPENSEEAEKAVMVILAKLQMALPHQANGETGAEAKGEAYLAAIEDLPYWALAAAVRGWYRGTSEAKDQKQPHDFRWCPAPATLAWLARAEMHKLAGRATALRRVVNAIPCPEYSDEYKSEMVNKITALIRGICRKTA